MLVPLTITVLLTLRDRCSACGHFLATPYWSDDSAEIAESINKATEQNAADAHLAPADDTPLIAAQIPALRAALEFAATAQFDLAAATLVAHATSHPRAAESPWALRRAYLYWHALGRDEDANLALRAYETHHAAREPRAAAEFFWSRRDHLEPSQRRDHLRTFLKRHAGQAPPDLRITAEAELAADLWRSSCTRTWHGLCVDFNWATRKATWATRKATCALGRAPLFTVHPRAATSREALRLAASATRRGRDLDLTRVAPWRRPALRAALGQATLVTTDAALEALVAVEFPRHMTFMVEEYKNTPEVPKWQKEYREQVRRRDDSARRFHRYWTTYNSLSRAALGHADALYAAGNPSRHCSA